LGRRNHLGGPTRITRGPPNAGGARASFYDDSLKKPGKGSDILRVPEGPD